MKAIVGTLFEGGYHTGAAALLNSLHAAGFRGTFVCGHRGPVPQWAEASRAVMDVRFVQVDTAVHLTYHKPDFLQTLLSLDNGYADQVFYFDPDIVTIAPWEVLSRWAADGVALCEDVNNYIPARHPYRLRWGDFLRSNSIEVTRQLDRYYNAGFIGLPRAEAPLLEHWRRVNSLCITVSGTASQLKLSGPNALFHSTDQDALNLALMSSSAPINGAGPESMGFAPGGHLLAHAVGRHKPWSGGFLRAALRGTPPSSAQKAFFRYANGPVPVFRQSQLQRLRCSLLAAALLGRLYRRA